MKPLIPCALMLLAPVVLAAPDTHTRDLVAQLDAESWLQRDLAMIELGELDQNITLEDLEAFIASPDLSPEQRARLTHACAMRFVAEPKGALGVQFGTIRIGAIEVQPIEANPNFPASTMLNPGDQIAMVGDTVIDGSLELRAEIISRRPGEVLPVTIIRRDAETGEDRLIELNLPLGSFDALTGSTRMDPILVHRALELRWQRAGLEDLGPETIGEGLDVARWSAAAFPQGQTPDPRQPDRRIASVLIASKNLPVQTGYGYAPGVPRPWSGLADLDEQVRTIATRLQGEQLQRLVARRLLLEQQRRQMLTKLRDTAEGEEADALRARTDAITHRLDAISAKIQSYRSLATEPNPEDKQDDKPEDKPEDKPSAGSETQTKP